MNRTPILANRRRALAAGAAAGALAATSGLRSALAQDSGALPGVLRILVGSTGAGPDILARLVAAHLSRTMGQPVLAENRAGASGIIAAEYVAKSAPDGYTLLFGGSSPMVFNPIVYDKLPYDPFIDLAPITVVGSYPLVITAKNNLPVKTLAEIGRAHV